MMNAARYELAQSIFDAAVDLAPDERDALLAARCGDDATLRADVLAMLDADARADVLLDRGMAHAAGDILLDRAALPLPTERFGPYRATGVLGEGGMGIVYLGRRDDLGAVAAIKVLRDAWLSPARRERFASEQRTLAQLEHRSIARLYDADTLADGTPWFVMEYVDGVPLTAYCEQHACSIVERLKLFREVCDAVLHAHQHLVIHRDIKPSNILVTASGAVKLLDFGIAKQLAVSDSPADALRTGLQLMTPAYAAPEQIRGGPVGIHTDVYSLGVVLYELLAGSRPYELAGRTPAEAEAIIAESQPAKPSVAAHRAGAGRAAWGDLDVLCLTAMHKDPARRYRSVEALIRDVDHFLTGQPLDARRDSVRYRVRKFVRRNQRRVAFAATTAAAAIALVVFYTARLQVAQSEALAETARTQRIQSFVMKLFNGGDDDVGPADSLRVVTMVDRGLREARALDAEPSVQAELYETLGTIYQKLGKLDRADTVLGAALAEHRRLFGASSPEVAASLLDLGLLRDAQADYDAAERLVRQALAIDRRTRPPGDATVARATSTLGRILEDRGQYDDAIATLERAATLQSADSSSRADLAETLTELANSHFYAGHYAISDSLNRRVLGIDRALYGPHHPNVADDLINLGAIQFEAGRYADAERSYRDALGIIRPWYGDDHPETASCLTLLGRALVAEGKRDDGIVMLRQALAIQERVYGPVHPRVASALNDLGLAADGDGKLDEAEADFRREADIYRTVYHDKHYYIGVALSNLAGVETKRGDYAAADSIFRDVIRRYGAVLPADHQLVGIARVRWGHVLLLEHRLPEAQAQLTAGYAIIAKQATPPAKWLASARTDLVALYTAMGSPTQAEQYRRELASATTGDATPAH